MQKYAGKGLSFPGVSLAIDPSGNIIKSYEGKDENIMIVDLNLEHIREIKNHPMKYFLPNRRPELYENLLMKSEIDRKK